MTSKISFSNFFKEHVKHNLAIYLIMSIFCLFRIVMFIISVQYTLTTDTYTTVLEKQNHINSLIGPDISFAFYGIFLGIMLALGSFRYLQVRSMSDLIHSLPMTRTAYFSYEVACDFIMLTLTTVVTTLINCLIAAIVHHMTLTTFTEACMGILCLVLITMMNYLTMVLAILMTGHLFVSTLGYLVFISYAPVMLRYLPTALASTFYQTYSANESIGWMLKYFSPHSLALSLVAGQEEELISTFHPSATTWLACILFLVVMFFLCSFLYKIRPAEAASKAMAFKKTEAPIRMLVIIPLAIYFGLFLYEGLFTVTKMWVLFGTLLGILLFHGFMEGIYNFDVKAIFKHKLQLFASLVIAIGIICFYMFDLSGFDAFRPDKDSVASITVEQSQYPIGIYNDNFFGSKNADYAGEDLDAFLDALTPIIENSHTTSNDETASTTEITLTYHLRNGRQKTRRYHATPDQKQELLKFILDSKEFKETINPLYSADLSDIGRIIVSSDVKEESLALSDAEKEELVSTYLEEYTKLDYKAFTTEAPLTSLSLELAIDDYGMHNFYIYPSFKKTIAFLESRGIHTPYSIDELDIDSISYYYYDDKVSEDTTTITDQELIKKLQPQMLASSCGNLSDWISFGNKNCEVYIDASFEGKMINGSISIYLPEEAMILLENAGR